MVSTQPMRRSCGLVILAQDRGQDRAVIIVLVVSNPTS